MKLLAMAVLLAMITFACSSESDDETLELEPAESSTATTTTSTIATATALSEQAQAEADVAQLVEDFWFAPFDTSQDQYGAEYLTGLIATRSREYAKSVTADGQIARDFGQKTLEIVRVQVDLSTGLGEVSVCAGSHGEIVDRETLEQLVVEDPTYLTTSMYLVEKSDEGWRINDLFASQATDAPELCEILSRG